MTTHPTLQAARAAVPEAIMYAMQPDGACIAYEPGDTLPTPTLASRQAARWEAIKAHRDMLSDSGGYSVTVSGAPKWFHSDNKSKIQQQALVMLGASIPAGLQWKTMDGTFVAMTQALAGQVFAAAVAQDSAIFAAAETHRAAMLQAADPDAYDFSGGWPAVYGG